MPLFFLGCRHAEAEGGERGTQLRMALTARSGSFDAGATGERREAVRGMMRTLKASPPVSGGTARPTGGHGIRIPEGNRGRTHIRRTDSPRTGGGKTIERSDHTRAPAHNARENQRPPVVRFLMRVRTTATAGAVNTNDEAESATTLGGARGIGKRTRRGI
jgi:hypothetical protein